MKTRKILKLLLVMILLFSSTTIVFATGYRGYAIHRDGAFFNTTWHAGMMDENYSDSFLPVLHINSLDGGVQWDTWDNFINDNTFMGVYEPKGGISESSRDLVYGMGRLLRTESIVYTPFSQIDYLPAVFSQTRVFTHNIGLIRCDGVVEYVYEWYGYRIYGNDKYWDITQATWDHLIHHSLAAVTPKKQAQDYMQLVRNSPPVSP